MLAVRMSPKCGFNHVIFAHRFDRASDVARERFELNQVVRTPRAPLLSLRRVLDKRAQSADETHLVDGPRSRIQQRVGTYEIRQTTCPTDRDR